MQANARTRTQNTLAGSSVDLRRYLQTMQEASCDGDAVTLQALSDVTGAHINVLKFTENGGALVGG